MTLDDSSLNSGTEVNNLPAQRDPDEVAELPCRVGAVPSVAVGSARRAPGAQSAPLGSYRISHSNPSEMFLGYLQSTKKYRFRLTGKNKEEDVIVTIPYVHRWTELYQKSILAKFYALEAWMKDHPGIVTLFTLTTYQGAKSRFNDGSYSRIVLGRDLTIPECFNLLKHSRTKLLNVLRNRYTDINYVWMLEPHKTGYPHCHLVVFRDFSDSEQIGIKDLWSEKYRAGSFDYGVDINSKKSEESILSIRNYLMKYMIKQFGTGEKYWTDGELLFNAHVWQNSSRMWGASKDLTAVMRKPKTDSVVVWDTVELCSNGEYFVIWSREDENLLINFNAELDPDDICPEGDVTKQFWKNLYEGIERVRIQYKI